MYSATIVRVSRLFYIVAHPPVSSVSSRLPIVSTLGVRARCARLA
jgi:hypothetical protein